MGDTTDYPLVKARLLEALDLPVDALEPWLADLAQQDERVASRVRRLLQAHRDAGGFLDVSDDGTAPADGIVALGQQIGPFTVERELGHGGMGTVLLGSRREGGFTQHVAIKVLRGAGFDANAAARLREERRILAALNHPSIAHFVDGGTTADGQPYLAMEYVEGVPITTFCDAHSLAQRDRVRLFMRVCEAVHFAHQRLVVHRDIKPSNILVSADGSPKLLDFGIAKLIDPLQAPGVATLPVLTPFYASPEQAAGASVTTATDVYSLGVLLYQLLTGSGPYRTVSPDSAPLAVLDAIRHEAPERPSVAAARAGRTVDEDLDAILLKALRKEEAERYSSVEQLSQDLGRYLAGRPVRAHDGSRAYHARKFVARHRGAVVAAVVAVLSLTAAAVVSTYQAQVARRERALADARFNDVRRLANAVVGPLYDEIAKVPGSTTAQNALVKEALTYLDELAAQAADDIELKAELAAAYQKIGDIQGSPFGPNLGDVAGATASYNKLLTLTKAVSDARPRDVPAQLAVAAAELRIGDISVAQSRTDDAIRAYEQGLALLATAPSDPPPEEWVLAKSRLHARYGNGLNRASRHDEAIVQLQNAVTLVAPIAELESASEPVLQALTASQSSLGDSLYYKERYADALTQFEAALKLARRIATMTPDVANSQRNLYLAGIRVGAALAELGRLDEAATVRGEALGIQTRLAALDPANAGLQFDLAITHQQQAMLHSQRKDFEAAHKEITIALDILKTSLDAHPEQRGRLAAYADMLGELGAIETGRGRLGNAIDAYRKAVAIIAAPDVIDPKQSDRWEFYEAFGDALAAQAAATGSVDLRREAQQAYQTALDGYRALEKDGSLPPSIASKPKELAAKLARPTP